METPPVAYPTTQPNSAPMPQTTVGAAPSAPMPTPPTPPIPPATLPTWAKVVLRVQAVVMFILAVGLVGVGCSSGGLLMLDGTFIWWLGVVPLFFLLSAVTVALYGRHLWLLRRLPLIPFLVLASGFLCGLLLVIISVIEWFRLDPSPQLFAEVLNYLVVVPIFLLWGLSYTTLEIILVVFLYTNLAASVLLLVGWLLSLVVAFINQRYRLALTVTSKAVGITQNVLTIICLPLLFWCFFVRLFGSFS